MVISSPAISKLIHGTFVNKECIRFVDTAKNLGVRLDSSLSFDHQMNKTVSSCYESIRSTYQLKHFLGYEQIQT